MEIDKLIEIKKTIKSFSAYSQNHLLKTIDSSRGEIVFPFAKDQIIDFENSGSVKLSISPNSEDSIVLRLSVADFELKKIQMDFLKKIQEVFELKKNVGINPSYYSLYISSEKDYGCSEMLLKKIDRDLYYLMIYATKRTRDSQSMAEDFFPDNIVFVHGIWEIELSNDLVNKLT